MEELRELIVDLQKKDKSKYKNEQAVKLSFIIPILRKLNWDIEDPDIVFPEYSVEKDGRVDYALLYNEKPIIFIEAKKILEDINKPEYISQIDRYANNKGVRWFIITSGLKWSIGDHNITETESKNKIVLTINLNKEVMELEKELEKLKLLDYNLIGNLANGIENEVLDEKVRLSLKQLLDNPLESKYLIKAIAELTGLKEKDIKENLSKTKKPEKPKIAELTGLKEKDFKENLSKTEKPENEVTDYNEEFYSEEMHLEGKPEWIIECYRKLDSINRNLSSDITIEYKKCYIAWLFKDKCFCSSEILSGARKNIGLKIWIDLDTSIDLPSFIKCMTNIGHHGIGDYEITIHSLEELENSIPYIKQSYNKIRDGIKNK